MSADTIEETETEQAIAELKPAHKNKGKTYRSNAEILAADIARRKARKRIRRTKAQIEADNAAEAKRRQELAEKRAARIPTPKPITFKKIVHVLVDKYWQFGQYYNAGDKIKIVEGTREFSLAFNANGEFIFNKSPEDQLAQWGVVKYEVE